MKNYFNLNKEKIILMGASSNIGLTCGLAFQKQGAEILLVGRNPAKLKLAKKKFNPAKIKVECLDLSDLKQLEELFKRNYDYNVLFNSLGTNDPKSMLKVDEKNYNSIMDLNMKNAFFQTQYFFRNIKKRKKLNGNYSIIHISSQMGIVGGFERSVYCASKHALEGFIKATSIELGQYNIRINSISPTFIKTPLTASTFKNPQKMKKILSNISLNRLGQSKDVVGAAIYLASSASSLVTGSTIKVDGGWTAH